MENDASAQNKPIEACLECGSAKLVEKIREQEFTYGSGDKAVS